MRTEWEINKEIEHSLSNIKEILDRLKGVKISKEKAEELYEELEALTILAKETTEMYVNVNLDVDADKDGNLVFILDFINNYDEIPPDELWGGINNGKFIVCPHSLELWLTELINSL